MERCASNLPPEVLAMVFQYLDSSDLVSASGVNTVWYSSASWELSRRGISLYRWPFGYPKSEGGHLVIAGERSLEGARQLLEGFVQLSVYMDVPTRISPAVMAKLINPRLRSLKVRNVIMNVETMRIVLASELTALKINTKRTCHLSKRARDLLLEHRELFEELVICDKKTYTTLSASPLEIADGCRIQELDVRIDEQLERLEISDGSHITEEDLFRISRLQHLKTFSISECNLHNEVLKESFKNGFNKINSINLTNCYNLSADCVELICKKINLKKIQIDLRHVGQFERCFLAICNSSSLKNVVIRVSLKINFENIKQNLKINGRKSIVLINEIIQLDDNFSQFNFENGSKFIYINPRTTNYIISPEIGFDNNSYWTK